MGWAGERIPGWLDQRDDPRARNVHRLGFGSRITPTRPEASSAFGNSVEDACDSAPPDRLSGPPPSFTTPALRFLAGEVVLARSGRGCLANEGQTARPTSSDVVAGARVRSGPTQRRFLPP